MVIKKTFDGDSPLRQGAEKSFWTLPIFGSTAAADHDVFWKCDRYLGFSRRGVFIGEGAASGVGRGDLTHRGRGLPLVHAALLCGALVAPLRILFGSLEAPVKFWAIGFGFVQFREYFLCNFSETQK
jgi:hypothetical protein